MLGYRGEEYVAGLGEVTWREDTFTGVFTGVFTGGLTVLVGALVLALYRVPPSLNTAGLGEAVGRLFRGGLASDSPAP